MSVQGSTIKRGMVHLGIEWRCQCPSQRMREKTIVKCKIPGHRADASEFPERPNALGKFLNGLRKDLNISLFHYRNHGAGESSLVSTRHDATGVGHMKGTGKYR